MYGTPASAVLFAAVLEQCEELVMQLVNEGFDRDEALRLVKFPHDD